MTGAAVDTDKRDILLCQAAGDFLLYRNDPDAWDQVRIGYAQQLGVSREIIENEIWVDRYPRHQFHW